MCNAMTYAGKTQRRVASAWIGTAFVQDDAVAARKQWREMADQARPRIPKLAKLMDGAEADVLAYMGSPGQHRVKLHSTNLLEHLNGEIKRRSDVAGIFPNEAAVIQPTGALLLEQNEEWAVQRAICMSLETIAPLGDTAAVSLPPRQPDRIANAAQERRSYITPWDMTGPAPPAPRACAPQAKTCSLLPSSSWLPLLRSWSLR